MSIPRRDVWEEVQDISRRLSYLIFIVEICKQKCHVLSSSLFIHRVVEEKLEKELTVERGKGRREERKEKDTQRRENKTREESSMQKIISHLFPLFQTIS